MSCSKSRLRPGIAAIAPGVAPNGSNGDDGGPDETDGHGAGPALELDVEIGLGIEVGRGPSGAGGDDPIHVLTSSLIICRWVLPGNIFDYT